MNKVRYLFNLLLFGINVFGIVGAFLEVFGIWRSDTSYSDSAWLTGRESMALSGGLLWGGLLLLCVVAASVWQGAEKKKIWLRVGICMLLYFVLAVLFGKAIRGGVSLALQNAVDNLNNRYQFHIAWRSGGQLLAEAGVKSGWETVLATLSLLFCLFPLMLLAGFLWVHDRGFGLAAGHLLWFTAACSLNNFPGMGTLSFCVIGLVAALVQKEFADAPGAGFRAVAVITVFTIFSLGFIFRGLLPILDRQYEGIQKERDEFYRVVNEEWIPGVQDMWSGIGPGIDVTGTLNRTNVFSYTSSDMYQVSVDKVPESALYLRGYVGGTYGKREWEAQEDQVLEHYYAEHGLDLPQDYGKLVNITYEAIGALEDYPAPESIRIKELGGKGTYSVYPYGVCLAGDEQVHGDGTVMRRSNEYEFQYRDFSGRGGNAELQGEWKKLEEQYRRYVYDHFLDYPEESLPLLTKQLEEEKIRTDSIYTCALDIMDFLDRQADYNLDAGRNPLGTDFVEYFLFESHEGYCVHFASAAVLAFRYFGIPARYATGYAVSPSNFYQNLGGDYKAVVTGKQAHAWAEIYLDAVGWVPVEMTPGAVAFRGDNRRQQLESLGLWQEEGTEEVRGDEQESPSDIQASEELPEEGIEDVPEPLPEPQKDPEGEPAVSGEVLTPPPEQEKTGVAGGGQAAGKNERDSVILLTIAGAVFLLGIFFILCCLAKRQNHRWHGALRNAGTGECISLLYENLRKALGIMGCSGGLAVGGEEFLCNMRKVCPEMGNGEYEAFCTILEKNAFGRMEPSAAELQVVRFVHDKLVSRVYAGVPFYKRFLFKVFRCYV